MKTGPEADVLRTPILMASACAAVHSARNARITNLIRSPLNGCKRPDLNRHSRFGGESYYRSASHAMLARAFFLHARNTAPGVGFMYLSRIAAVVAVLLVFGSSASP